MKTEIKLITQQKSLNEMSLFLLRQFSIQEQEFYTPANFVDAKNFFAHCDVCDPKKLYNYIINQKISIYGLYEEESLVGGLCYDLKNLNIRFIVSTQKEKEENFKLMFDKLISLYPKNKESKVINCIALLSNIKSLEKIGFFKLSDYYLLDNSVKVWPMRYIDHQIDIER